LSLPARRNTVYLGEDGDCVSGLSFRLGWVAVVGALDVVVGHLALDDAWVGA